MKKAFVLALILVMVMSVGVFAAEETTKVNDGKIAIGLTVHPHVEVSIPQAALKFAVDGDGGSDNGKVIVAVKSNTPILVTVVSKGFYQDNQKIDLLNKMVTYTISNGDFTDTFNPDSTWEAKFQAAGVFETYTVGLALDYNPGNDWYKVVTGHYGDTLAWTVEPAI